VVIFIKSPHVIGQKRYNHCDKHDPGENRVEFCGDEICGHFFLFMCLTDDHFSVFYSKAQWVLSCKGSFMKKLLCLSVVLLSACVESDVRPVVTASQPVVTQKSPADYAQTYMMYLQTVGKTAPEKISSVSHPFAPTCTKIINGEIVVHNAGEFVQQLSDTRQATDPWVINVMGIFPDTDHNAATIVYDINAKPLGIFHVIKVVHFDRMGLVVSVRENYVKLKE